MAAAERPSVLDDQAEVSTHVEPGKVMGFIGRNRGKLGLVIGALLTHATWIAVLHMKATEELQQTVVIPVGMLICGEDAISGVRQCFRLPFEELQQELEGCPDTNNSLPPTPNLDELCPDIDFPDIKLEETFPAKPAEPSTEEGQRI